MANLGHRYVEKLELLVENYREEFDNHFSLVDWNIASWYKFLDEVVLEAAHTPRRQPYTIGH